MQAIKSGVNFSSDATRGDGLRGWCKGCEAEARAGRYKRRKSTDPSNVAAKRRRAASGLCRRHGSFTTNYTYIDKRIF